MINARDGKRIRKLRVQVTDFAMQVVASPVGCTKEPIPIQLIWSSISRGDTESLRYWIDWAAMHVQNKAKWRSTINAAKTLLDIWLAVERNHGAGCLLDIDQTLRLYAGRPETESVVANARRFISQQGQANRDELVKLTFADQVPDEAFLQAA
ncbi:hypothetical protein LVY75_05215 (plasmid) [Sinorhizobium sp. B11]